MSAQKRGRVSLSEVMEQADTPPTSGTKGERRGAPKVQVNVLLPSDLHQRAKIKAVSERTNLSAVVEKLLSGWANE